ncbi:MAG: tetratricopeptide repeat protein [Deltaproteobacteria bacterium]|nr:tetratricopeptide repeat protein [Deltaproteobacteria bacterium]
MGDLLNKEAVLEQARLLLDAGRIDKAIHEYQKLAAADPNDLRLLLRIAELHVKVKQIAQAVKLYREVAERYIDEGFYLKAVTVYKTVLRINPSLREANMALAELYEKMGLDQDAIHQYQILLRYYEQKGFTDKVLELRRRIVGLDPDQVSHRVRLAETYQLQGDDAATLREYEVLAEQLKDRGTHEQLIDLYERILSRRPAHLDILKRLCRLLHVKGEYRRILPWLSGSDSLAAEDPDLMQLHADVLARLNQMESARGKWRELAELWVSRGEEGEAMRAYEELLALAPEEASEIEEAVERLHPGTFADLRLRVDARVTAQAKAVEEEAKLEAARAEAAGRIAEQEEKARARASRRAPADSTPVLQGEEVEGARHRAEASVQLGDAYLQMGMREEGSEEYRKAIDWYRRLLTSGAGSQRVIDELRRLEQLLSLGDVTESSDPRPVAKAEAVVIDKAATPPPAVSLAPPPAAHTQSTAPSTAPTSTRSPDRPAVPPRATPRRPASSTQPSVPPPGEKGKKKRISYV